MAKFITKQTWVDRETGELLNKKEVNKHYIITGKEITVEHKTWWYEKSIRYICEKSKQQSLF